jgi:Ca2+-binding RTX toxin-like protein
MMSFGKRVRGATMIRRKSQARDASPFPGFATSNNPSAVTMPERGYATNNVTLYAAGGSADFVTGSSGNDFIVGGAGDDTLKGEAGDDLLVGGAGDDRLSGGAGRNFLTGGAGKDTVFYQSTGGSFNLDLKVVTVLGNSARGWLGVGNPADSAELYTGYSGLNDNLPIQLRVVA